MVKKSLFPDVCVDTAYFQAETMALSQGKNNHLAWKGPLKAI